MSEKLYVNLEFYVAGVKHHQYREVRDELEEGMSLSMIPDPANEYDKNAIKIMYDDVILGHVPMKAGQSKHISQALRQGIDLRMKLTRHNINAENDWKRLKVWVKEKDLFHFVKDDTIKLL